MVDGIDQEFYDQNKDKYVFQWRQGEEPTVTEEENTNTNTNTETEEEPTTATNWDG